MVRGFKKLAEEISEEVRSELGLDQTAPLKAVELAKKYNVLVITPRDIPGLGGTAIRQLLVKDKSSWSAVTLEVDHRFLVIYNTSHSDARVEADLMHEMAHIIRGHKPNKLLNLRIDGLMIRSYDNDQEEEANWLGPCLQIPRRALLRCVQRGMTNEVIARKYHASLALVRFRRNMTGVNRQARYYMPQF